MKYSPLIFFVRIPFIILLVLAVGTTRSFAQKAVKDEKEIHQFIDNWHLAASQANGKLFFESMGDQSVYIGTDANERWTKAEFVSFAKPYFDKGKAWDFKAYDRDLHVTKSGKIVWFSELLTTWMGVCRGSGVLEKTSDGWKIQQYHLSVTVPNEIIKNFVSLVEDFHKQSPKPGN